LINFKYKFSKISAIYSPFILLLRNEWYKRKILKDMNIIKLNIIKNYYMCEDMDSSNIPYFKITFKKLNVYF